MPIAGFFMLLLATAIMVPCSGRWKPAMGICSLPGMVLSRPELWDITLFILLFVYPVISRKSVAAFGCVPFANGDVLADDTSVPCFDAQWWSYAYVAIGGMAFFCLGMPFIIWLVVRSGHTASSPVTRRIFHALTWIYHEDCWYAESVDLLRKFMLTGVVTVTWVGTRRQLLFGTLVRSRTCLSHSLLVCHG
jgi:hypothetical protein